MKKDDLYKKIFNEASKINQNGQCLWDTCSSPAIKSHSHTETILRNISFNNHVYGINKNFLSVYNGDFFHRYGVQGASIFHGFCSVHDSGLFRDIEQQNLENIGNKEAFLLLTRSVFFELYQKKSAILRTKKLIGLLKKYKLLLNEEFAECQIRGNQFYIENDFPQYENKIYQHFDSSDYNDVIFRYHKVEKAVPISLSTNINPLFHEHVPKAGVAQPFFAFHILPYKTYGLVVLSWFKEYDSNMRWVKDMFDSDLNVLINYLCFIESEDFLLSPEFYNRKIRGNRDFFSRAFFNRVSFPKFGFNDTKIFFNFI